MAYEARNFEHLLGIEGLSDKLLKNHFTLYQGYVTNTNKLIDELGKLEKEGKAGTPEYAELRRRFGWEWNGMRLHEYYFGKMTRGGKEIDKNTNLYRKIVKDFGSYENWEKDFKATGMMRGIGWAVLYYDITAGRLLNVWINEHDGGHLSGASPILIMDVFEHAFMIDYGTKRADYIEAFFKAIDWTIDPELDSALFGGK
ncbi:superoxide dismutase [Candidatus Methanoperedens nitroreducens]|uniref:superoxide dismutase n=1 Tax=Candidatus Methanoperedens nitratireducens TaxID=1392998 RepID=A0A062V9F8_9EURY|nr:Fe-Mn family superoxide dismutase [Candidatus Methanoperedens nitroreducens]KCZ73193.1 superoxide dismutase [Candidatus Methanoperedens nitroreducens]MDJ1422858.1 Fe-Mn family superoxide dismutase [Candidatus Methanoperedens sp.]